MGPMRAAAYFVEHYEKRHKLAHVHTITIELFGALAHTGEGHGTVPAVLLGLEGQTPETITPKYLKNDLKKSPKHKHSIFPTIMLLSSISKNI